MRATTGFGVVGLGIGGEPSRTHKAPELCADLGHPGCTYNHRLDLTWCLCGAVITDGDTAVPHVACCGGPLGVAHLSDPTHDRERQEANG